MAESDWDKSAEAWIAHMHADGGGWGRAYVLDPIMTVRVSDRGFRKALDVGCGEGRFCRVMQEAGIETVGIDPTERLLVEARSRDPDGDYRVGRAEALEVDDNTFDLVVTYLTLIDIADYRVALSEMARVLAPGGTLLIANLTSMNTAATVDSQVAHPDGTYYPIRDYMQERSQTVGWRGIEILNHHRPLSGYMQALLETGLRLVRFDEPVPKDFPDHHARKAARYSGMPYFLVMEWRKDSA